MATITRRAVLTAAVVSLMAPRIAWAVVPSITVHKDPNCGCCGGWIDHLRANGFSAKVIETGRSIGSRRGWGCPRSLRPAIPRRLRVM